ncbi:uncharacterized protein TNCT_186741 [Trichonephila clavata]|uniref:Cuticle protein n=1 Tax=Trichonephila clavata TaxID=2740835 RepID=A0A8X6KI57_TRICU|nr:uncharacterized protein TNCT_186741 [Trichonephila clavata]
MKMILISALLACMVMLTSCEYDSINIFPKYKFQFKTGDDGDHTRAEESDTTGQVTGMYSYVDPNGILRTIRYKAAPGTGYQAFGEGILQIGSDFTTHNSWDGNYVLSHNNESDAQDESKSSNDTFQQEIEPQASEKIAAETVDESIEELPVEGLPVEELPSISLAQNDTLNELKSASRNSSDDASTSFHVNHNRNVPLLFPYGPYHPIFIHPGSVLHTIPQAFTYNLLAPRYQFIL